MRIGGFRRSRCTITTEVYRHLAPAYLQSEVDRLQFEPPPPKLQPIPPETSEEQRAAPNAGFDPFAASLLQASASTPITLSPPDVNPEEISSVNSARPSGFEPHTFGFGGSTYPSAGVSKRLQSVGNTRIGAKNRIQPSQALVKNSSRFVTQVLQGLSDPLLTVREVAERLRVSTATVYTMCQRGELEHTRVGNSIRVTERALEGFIRGVSVAHGREP